MHEFSYHFMSVVFIIDSVCTLCADSIINKALSFFVRSLSFSSSLLGILLKCSKSIAISHVLFTFGAGVLNSKIPLIKVQMSGSVPIFLPSTVFANLEIAHFAVFIVL